MGSHLRMKTAIKIVMVGIFMMTQGEAKDELENIVKEMRMEVNELRSCLEETKAELVELKTKNMELKERLETAEDDLTATKDDLTATKDDLTATKDDLTANKDDLTTTNSKLDDLTSFLDNLTSKDHELERDVSIIRNPPFIHSCGSHYEYLSITSQTIPYNNLLYSSTNTEGGGLDIARGVFTSPLAGSYTVTWSLAADDDAGDHSVVIYLRQNGQKIEESRHYSDYSGPSGQATNQGGRTLVLHLDMGDTLDLYCDNCSAYIYRTTFCESLSTFDII